jgi:hypothetical protein
LQQNTSNSLFARTSAEQNDIFFVARFQAEPSESSNSKLQKFSIDQIGNLSLLSHALFNILDEEVDDISCSMTKKEVSGFLRSTKSMAKTFEASNDAVDHAI